MRDWLVITNSFIHDTATGLWVAGLYLMARLESVYGQGTLFYEFNRLVWLALVVVMLTGAFRAITFRQYGWTGDVAKERKRLLLIKHGILGALIITGIGFHLYLLNWL